MSEENVLKETGCKSCNEFSEIRSFCFNCPSLMCSDCERRTHLNLRHDIVKINNLNLDWNNKDSIVNLFHDREFGTKIFQEVARIIVLNEDNHEGDDDGWQCSSCTLMNPLKNTKCDACSIYRKTAGDDSMQYNEKLEGLLKKMSVLESELYEYENVTFEHVAKEYLINSDYYPDFGRWFQEKYLVDKKLSIINDIIANAGHNITRQQLSEKYEEFVKIHNKCLIERLPKSLLPEDLLKTQDYFDQNTVNKRNIIPDNIKKKETDKDSLWNVIIQEDDYSEHQIRMILTEMNLPSTDKVQLLRAFIRDESLGPYLQSMVPLGTVTIDDIRNALVEYMTIVEGLAYLRKECSICCDEFPTPKMQSLLTCEHEMCKNCFQSWLVEAIEKKFPCKWNCSVCPDEKYEHVDRNMHIFNLRSFIDENKLSEKTIKIFDQKLLNERLMTSESFHWCCNEQCENGFESVGIKGKAQCPSCKADMCLDCNRKWCKEHENITCQEFELFMITNDPNLANALKDIGIECPNCGMRYALAAGGCLHFDCKACGIKFCGGCYTLFTDNCNAVGCTMGTGFHGHHPRNCIYFLRDRDIDSLEKMLEKTDYPRLKDKPEKQCPFVITDKLTMKDTNCNKDVQGTSGLCELHYKEYMIQFINRLKVDPMEFADSGELNLMLFQALTPQLTRLPDENENAFVARLKEEVKKCKFYVPKGLFVGKKDLNIEANDAPNVDGKEVVNEVPNVEVNEEKNVVVK